MQKHPSEKGLGSQELGSNNERLKVALVKTDSKGKPAAYSGEYFPSEEGSMQPRQGLLMGFLPDLEEWRQGSPQELRHLRFPRAYF